MGKLHRMADLQDCINIEKGIYIKARKEQEKALNEILKCYEEIIRISLKTMIK